MSAQTPNPSWSGRNAPGEHRPGAQEAEGTHLAWQALAHPGCFYHKDNRVSALLR